MKNLFDCMVLMVPVVVGFIAVGKTKRSAGEVSVPLFIFYDLGDLRLFFGQYKLCFSLGNEIPCLVRKQADFSDPLIAS